MDIDWMTTGDVARELGLTAETVRQHIRERRLRASVVTAGEQRSVFRIRREDLDAFRAAYVRDSLHDDWER